MCVHVNQLQESISEIMSQKGHRARNKSKDYNNQNEYINNYRQHFKLNKVAINKTKAIIIIIGTAFKK